MSYADWLAREYYYMRYKEAGRKMAMARAAGHWGLYRSARATWRYWGGRYNEAVKYPGGVVT